MISDHDDQYDEFYWWTIDALLQSNMVHKYAKDYFKSWYLDITE